MGKKSKKKRRCKKPAEKLLNKQKYTDAGTC